MNIKKLLFIIVGVLILHFLLSPSLSQFKKDMQGAVGGVNKPDYILIKQ